MVCIWEKWQNLPLLVRRCSLPAEKSYTITCAEPRHSPCKYRWKRGFMAFPATIPNAGLIESIEKNSAIQETLVSAFREVRNASFSLCPILTLRFHIRYRFIQGA
jgi:hypothetical protein